jgi:hypothetical protein
MSTGNLKFLNKRAELYYAAFNNRNSDLVQLYANGYDGIFLTLEAYKALLETLSPFDRQTHQVLNWDAGLLATMYPEAKIYTTLDLEQLRGTK